MQELPVVSISGDTAMALAGKKFDAAHTETETGDGTVIFWASIDWGPRRLLGGDFKVAEALLGTLDNFVSL